MLTFISLTVLVVDRYLPLTCTTVPVYPDNGANDVNTGGGHKLAAVVPEVNTNGVTVVVPDVVTVVAVIVAAFILLMFC